jgi:hypothetical protein
VLQRRQKTVDSSGKRILLFLEHNAAVNYGGWNVVRLSVFHIHAQYDFSSLSPIDFEILVRDLLQKELKITLESSSDLDAGLVHVRKRIRSQTADGRRQTVA